MEQSMKVLFSNAGPDPEIEAHDKRLAVERRDKPESGEKLKISAKEKNRLAGRPDGSER
jgi:hypothetical protein